MKNCKQKLTIRNIINSLTDIMTRNSSIDLDSEVIVANAKTLEEFDNIRIYPVRDVFYGQDRVGIYIEPKQVEVREELKQKVIQEDLLDIVEEPVQEASNNNWWDKYK